MSTATVLLRPRIRVPADQARRYLGLHRGSRAPRASVLELVDARLEAAEAWLDPRASIRVSRSGLAGSAAIGPRVPVALAVCTIGPAVEGQASLASERGDSLGAFVLDAIGSAAVEALADHANQHLCETALGAGLEPARRQSPGYGRWAVEEQRWLFDHFDPEELGVRLTEGCMMVPRKSVSFAVILDRGVVEGAPGRRAGGRCAGCAMPDCRYRELPAG